ncbi:MAG: anti-sigma factor family protein [Longimicrobiales bacterium]
MSERPPMSCREAIEQLWAYIDGELPADDATLVHDHLEACTACYPHYDFQRAFCTYLRTRTPSDTPAGLRRRIFLLLLEEESGEPFPHE